MSVPALPTLRVPMTQIGNCSADNLIAQIAGSEAPQHERLEIGSARQYLCGLGLIGVRETPPFTVEADGRQSRAPKPELAGEP
jgi:hypothetical protein